MRDRRRPGPWSALVVSIMALAPGAHLLAAPADSCRDLMRELKLVTFDGDWVQVEHLARRLIDLGPDCEHREPASRLLAQALDRQGRDTEAFVAYDRFLASFCSDTTRLTCSRARTDLYRLATSLYSSEHRQKYLDVLLDGMEQDGDTGLVAALDVAALPAPRLRALALPRLKSAYAGDLDSDIRDRVCLAMMKIDPRSAPCASGPSGGDDGSLAELISVEVFDKTTGKPQLRVNMPVALAEAVIRALPDSVHEEMAKEGVDIREIFQAIREQHSGTLFEAETEEMKVRIWLQ
ncbi:MAG: hypothetical protein ACE5IK_12240 [Acidobacteriota bacterium]